MISIICADDDDDIQLLYRTILGKRDYSLRIFDNGVDCVEAFKTLPADIVLLDMEMPGLSGLETCKEIRKLQHGGKVPIFIVSSRDDENTIMQSLSTGADDYILKPFKAAEILAKVSHALKRRKAGLQNDVALSYSDKYEIVRKIDEGGATTVYLADDISRKPSREVALKIFKPGDDEKSDEYFKTMFLREAYEWSKLKHKNIVELYDFGQSAGSYFLVLEYIDGTTLWDRVEDYGPVDEAGLIAITHELVLALDYIVGFGLVHRDMKPNNILLSKSGDVKVTDFGLAKQKEDSRITVMHNVFKGTPDFVSPEQVEGKQSLDIRSDIYSLGATIYYAATTLLPFRGDSIIETLNNHFKITPKPIHEVYPDYSRAFSDIVAQMMVKDAASRINLHELQAKITHLLEHSKY